MIKRGTWMPTASGGRFSFDPIDVRQVKLLDIALGLGRQPRFNGQWRYGPEHYSVAEHSVWASYLAPAHLALPALVHDAHEALIGDMTSPLKAIMPEYCAFEDRFQDALAAHFGWRDYKDPAVKLADLQMLAIERETMIEHRGRTFADLEGIETPSHIKIEHWPSDMAAVVWRDRYNQLRGR